MKIILTFAISLISIQAFTQEIEKIATEISQLTAPACSTDQKIDHEGLIQIGYLRGSPVDAANDPQAGENYLKLSREILEQKNFKVITASAHHTSWEMICRQFKNNLKGKSPNSKIILVGHSYGSSGALKVANCLNEAKIVTDLLITVSSFDFMSGVDITKIPSHVLNHYNLSVDNPLIPGYKTHTAINSDATKIQNIEAKVGYTHIGAAGKLLQTLALITSAEVLGKTASVKIGETMTSAEVNKDLSKIWNCQPANIVTETPSVPARETASEQKNIARSQVTVEPMALPSEDEDSEEDN